MNSTQSINVSHSHESTVGADLKVRQAIPFAGKEAIGPFIMLDHIGPLSVKKGRSSGTGPHPHAGFETLTYLIEGHTRHRDSLGNDSRMRNGEAQWMRAGRGVVHDEGPWFNPGVESVAMHGVQFWINLPAIYKQSEPEYQHILHDSIPEIEVAPGVVARVIAGDFCDHTGPVKTYAQPLLVHLVMEEGSSCELSWRRGEEAALYVASGGVMLSDATPVSEGQLASAVDNTTQFCVAARASESHLFLLAGKALDAGIYRHGPFVMNTAQQVQEAFQRYQRGSFGTI